MRRKLAGVTGILFGLGLLLWLWPSSSGSATPRLVWGQRGVVDGQFNRPRAIAIGPKDQIYIVDFTARIQRFDRRGQHTGLTLTTPDYRNGRPSGLGIDREGRLMVADSHYHAVRIYDEFGQEVRRLGGQPGKAPGQWGYVSDVVQDAEGYFYVSEFGENDRITKLNLAGEFVHCWGQNGQADGEFNRVRALAIGPDGRLYAADACNHRLQVFERDGRWVRSIGSPGAGLGEFSYPYDLAFSPEGDWLYVVERGNQRVQKFDRNFQAVAQWGGPGRKPGRLADPWAVAVDSRGHVHVVDTENHRVQWIDF